NLTRARPLGRSNPITGRATSVHRTETKRRSHRQVRLRSRVLRLPGQLETARAHLRPGYRRKTERNLPETDGTGPRMASDPGILLSRLRYAIGSGGRHAVVPSHQRL